MKPEEAGKPSRPHRGPALAMLLLVLTTVAVALGANIWTRDLTVREVTAEGNRIVPSADIIALAGIRKNERLYNIDLNAARKRIQANQFVRAVSLTREMPDRVEITVEERTPIAAIAGTRTLYVDADGVVLPPTRSEFIFDLPILTGALPFAELVPGKRVAAEDVREALQIIATAQAISDDLYRLISEVHIDAGHQIQLFTSESGVPVLFGRGDVAGKMMKFEAFWKEFVHQRGAGELQYIDLRFEDQIVVRWNQETPLASH